MHKSYRLLLLALVFQVVVGLFLAPKLNAQRLKQTLPASLDNLHEISQLEIKSSAGQIVLSGTFSTNCDTRKELEREAILKSPSGDVAVKGLAEIEIMKGGSSKKELEMKLERLTASSSFTMFVDGKEIMTLQTNKRGNAEIKLSTAIK